MPRPPPPGLTFSASARVRTEAWDWFTPSSSADERYAFTATVLRGGVGMKHPDFDWQVDLAVPVLLGLPDSAVAAAPQGQLGLGATYRAENGNRIVGLVAKQAFLRVKLGSSNSTPTIRLGRFEFNDGQESRPNDPTLAWLKRERIAQRLIGTFGFTHVGRSFDGVQLVRSTPNLDITMLAVRPTKGSFQLDGLGQVDAELAYVAVTKPLFFNAEGHEARAEGRLFGVYYHDGRDMERVDNRPASIRSADGGDIRIATVGAHYLHTFKAGPGSADVLLWGAAQTGEWGAQSHRAGAVAAELSYRPNILEALKPWVRVGYFLGTGDDTPGDGEHGTFFEILPTPRPFARVPFYNLMNLTDAFAQLIVSPSPHWSLRTDVHFLRLAERNDLWYAGGGAFDNQSFGYGGRPGGGARNLAQLLDLSVDYQPSPLLGATFYVGHVRGDDVIRSVYPQGTASTFAYLELRRQL
ncbi:MAG: alginate export family protein [Gemmatimonadales bacterium]